MSDLLAALNALRERLKEIPQADERRLLELKTELLGRKSGALTEILKALPSLDPDTRKRVGGAANALAGLRIEAGEGLQDFSESASLAPQELDFELLEPAFVGARDLVETLPQRL